MTEARWRFIDSGPGEGAWNMAVDEAILEAVRAGESPPTLRLYGWAAPTLSLGYAQRPTESLLQACHAAGVAVVRRPTGGRAVLHAGDLTYAIVTAGLPAGVAASYRLLATGLVEALAGLGVQSILGAGAPSQARPDACFASTTQADLRAGAAKLLGSAQVRRHGAVLQHGSLYLRYPAALAEAVFGAAGEVTDLETLLGDVPEPARLQRVFQEAVERALGSMGWEQEGLSKGELALTATLLGQ